MSVNRRLRQFAAAHLRTDAERAVYRVLVVAPDRDWSADDVAAAGSVDLADAAAVLRRLADAGAVDVVDGAMGGFRWSSAMRYLFDPELPSPRAFDPVCGMAVRDDRHRIFENDVEVLFCSLRCQLLYRRRRPIASAL